MNFYISDLHFGHKNCLSFDKRPFFTLKEMEEELIKRWNERVGRNDNVYILGDLFWNNERAGEILHSLHGNKFLIQGNHDRINEEMRKELVWCDKQIVNIKDEGLHVILSHYPIACWEAQFHTPPSIHLYGHIHASRDERPYDEYAKLWSNAWHMPFLAANVGCMLHYMDYGPRTLKEIAAAKGWDLEEIRNTPWRGNN